MILTIDDPRTGPDAAVTIGNDVWLSVNVTVMKGVTIGENTLVGAGSLVLKSLPAGVIAAAVWKIRTATRTCRSLADYRRCGAISASGSERTTGRH